MRKRNTEQQVTEFLIDHDKELYRLAFSYAKNKEDALDILQETALKALQASRSQQKIDKVKPWVYKILVNNSLDYLRKRAKVVPFSEVPEGSYEEESGDFDLEKAMEALKPEYKTVILLRYFEDLKLEDVAEAAGLNLSTAKSRLYTALKLLRIQLEDEKE